MEKPLFLFPEERADTIQRITRRDREKCGLSEAQAELGGGRPVRDAANQRTEGETSGVGAKILAVQDGLGHFTDRRAYVTASTYDIETTTSPSSKKSKQQDLDAYKAKPSTVEMPDGKVQTFKNFGELEEAYNELKNERTQMSAELGELLKPV